MTDPNTAHHLLCSALPTSPVGGGGCSCDKHQPNTTPHPCEPNVSEHPCEAVPLSIEPDKRRMDGAVKRLRLRAALHAKDAECEMLKEALHLADGTMRLAIKHRDAAEAEVEGLKASGWRDAGEANPMYAGQYLIKTTDDERAAWGWWDGEDWLAVTMVAGRITSITLRNIVTHWQPLPAPPKETDDANQD